MASSAKKNHPTGDSFITVKQEHQTGDSFITVKQEHQTGDSIITVKHAGDSIITVKHEHETGDSFITVEKQQHPTHDSFITVKVVEACHRVEHIWVKRDEPLQQLKMRWREQAGMEDYLTFRFVFNGRRIDDDNKTANDIGLKDGDYIHVMLVQTGD